jgi:hypothetical protein
MFFYDHVAWNGQTRTPGLHSGAGPRGSDFDSEEKKPT